MKNLRLKKASHAFLFTLLLTIGGISNLKAQEKALPFLYPVACDGGTVNLYFRVENTTNKTAYLSSPNSGWGTLPKPQASNIIIPETITISPTGEINPAYEYDPNGETYTITSIGADALKFCSDITGALVIPSTVTMIKANAFFKCTGLTSVSIPNSVTSIANAAFQGCSNLAGELVLPNSLATLGMNAFFNCSNLTGKLVIPNTLQAINQNAFENCSGLTSLVLPSSISSVKTYSFKGCTSIASIYSYRDVPPTIQTGAFEDIPTTTQVCVPSCSINSYQSATGWNRFNNYQGRKFFVGGNGNSNWSNANNWSCGTLPEANESIIIGANCDMDAIATIGTIDFVNDFYTLSIMEGGILTVSDAINNNGTAANLVIEDGGQLKYNATVAATLKREITGYGNGTRNNYYLIASPMTEELDATEVNGLLSEVYDLYTFDQNSIDFEWRNYKAEPFAINNTIGYLYASKTNTTVEIAGNTIPCGTDIPVNLEFNANAAPLCQGWNLVGNPFTCQAYVNTNYYVLNPQGNSFVNGNTIMPGQAIMVKATEEGQSINFSTTARNDSYIELSVVKNTSMDRDGLIDNARIRFGEGQGMDKFYLNGYGTRIFIPQDGKNLGMAYTYGRNEMPVNFKAETNDTYSINVNLMNIESEYLHLIDNLTGNDIDLIATPNYTFDAKTSDYESRFRLMFAPANNNANEESFAYICNGNLIINNAEGATLQVIDVTGRMLNSEVVNGNFGKSLNLSQGVYMLRLINGNDVKTQKIVVE